MVYNVLVAHIPIPTNTIGSWNVMITNLVEKTNGIFDYVISPKPYRDFDNCTHFYTKKNTLERPLSKLFKFYQFKCYYEPLRKLLEKEGNFVLNIIDNTGMLTAINYFLLRDGYRKRVKIIYHFHGFALNLYSNEYFNIIDTLIILTKSSYKWQINTTPSMPCKVRQVYNGVDGTKFYDVSGNEKKQLKSDLLFEKDKMYFLWLSQDRPKKGLHVILEAWKKIIATHSDVELIIVGIPPKENTKQVTYLGRFQNDQLPRYYQAADFYLFPTLWHEGHPLSLTEALKSGPVCIASNIDPVAEVMGNGSYGRLVDFPNDPASWVQAIQQELEKFRQAGHVNIYSKNIPSQLYDFNLWMQNIKAVMDDEKAAFVN